MKKRLALTLAMTVILAAMPVSSCFAAETVQDEVKTEATSEEAQAGEAIESGVSAVEDQEPKASAASNETTGSEASNEITGSEASNETTGSEASEGATVAAGSETAADGVSTNTATEELIDEEDLELVSDAKEDPYTSFETARVINVNQTYTGNLASTHQEQYYKFTINQPGYVCFYFDHEEVPSPKWNILLYSANDTHEPLLQRETVRFSGDRRYEGSCLAKGTYYVKIIKGRYELSTVEYRLCVRLDTSKPYETELNETTNTANDIAFGKIYYGNLRTDDDKDYYRFKVPQSGQYSFSFITDADGTPGYNYWRMTIFNANRLDQEISHYQYWAGHEEKIKGPLLLDPGTYYVRITMGDGNTHAINAPYGLAVNGVTDQVTAFVNRMYKVVFGRNPDQAGLNYWVSHLKNGTRTGADVIAEFYLGDEMRSKGLTNPQFVDSAYIGIMDRNPEPNGREYWVKGLDAGATYDSVASGFIASSEFAGLCSSYGINKGDRTPPEARDRNIGITEYVSRLYTKALGRNFDRNGLNYWCQIILDNTSRDNVIDVAFNGFFHSEEFLGRNLSNDEYIRVCYRTFLDREAEGEGFNYWKQLLDSGAKSRDDLVREFAYSQEFSGIMASYGL